MANRVRREGNTPSPLVYLPMEGLPRRDLHFCQRLLLLRLAKTPSQLALSLSSSLALPLALLSLLACLSLSSLLMDTAKGRSMFFGRPTTARAAWGASEDANSGNLAAFAVKNCHCQRWTAWVGREEMPLIHRLRRVLAATLGSNKFHSTPSS